LFLSGRLLLLIGLLRKLRVEMPQGNRGKAWRPIRHGAMRAADGKQHVYLAHFLTASITAARQPSGLAPDAGTRCTWQRSARNVQRISGNFAGKTG
jgi:hypothetical protein